MGLHRPQTAQSSQPQVTDEEDSLYLRFPSPGMSQTPLPPPTVHRSPPVVVSRAQRNLLWVLAAEGDETEIYAADMSGRDLGTWRLDPALYTEWTALALGRCDQKTCLYIGDLGDSLGRRGTVQLYRFEEPLLAFDRIPRTYSVTGVQKLIVGYPDGAHDARALVVNGRRHRSDRDQWVRREIPALFSIPGRLDQRQQQNRRARRGHRGGKHPTVRRSDRDHADRHGRLRRTERDQPDLPDAGGERNGARPHTPRLRAPSGRAEWSGRGLAGQPDASSSARCRDSIRRPR